MAHWSWKTKRIGAGFLQTPTWEWYTHSKHVLLARQQMNNVTPKKYLKASTCRAKSCHNPKWRQLEWYLPVSNLKPIQAINIGAPAKGCNITGSPCPYEYSTTKKRNVTPGNPSVKATVEKPTPKLQQCNCICRVQHEHWGLQPKGSRGILVSQPQKTVLWFYARPSEYWSWLAGQIAASPGPVAKPNVTRSVSWFSWRFFTKKRSKT